MEIMFSQAAPEPGDNKGAERRVRIFTFLLGHFLSIDVLELSGPGKLPENPASEGDTSQYCS